MSSSLDPLYHSVVAVSAEALGNWFSKPYEALRWGDYFIKFGDPSLICEAMTEHYLYEEAIRETHQSF